MAQAKFNIEQHDRAEIFIDLVEELLTLNDAAKRRIAEEAGVHWGTLYNWCAWNVTAPSSRTLIDVANALGYEIVLQRKTKKPKLKVVK